MICQGYGGLLSSPTLILFRQGHSQSGSSLLPSEKGTFFDGPILSTGISLAETFHLDVLCFSSGNKEFVNLTSHFSV